MATVLFYEKPGCRNNTRQKAMLELAGHVVKAINLLEYPWSQEELEPFLGNKKVAEWFNSAAPSIKSGEINPSMFTGEEAIALMLQEPLLIKRPLMHIGSHHLQGFDIEVLSKLITLEPLQTTDNKQKNCTMSDINDMNACPHSNNLSCNYPEE